MMMPDGKGQKVTPVTVSLPNNGRRTTGYITDAGKTYMLGAVIPPNGSIIYTHSGNYVMTSNGGVKADTVFVNNSANNTDTVRAVQARLNALNYRDASGNPLVVDGNFGPRTEQAVNRFKNAVLPGGNTGGNQGVVGATTMSFLFADDAKRVANTAPIVTPAQTATAGGADDLDINRKISKSENYSSGRTQTITYIVVHYTANNGDTAKNNADYFARESIGASAHYFVDENEYWQSVDDDDTAWHCGTKGTYRHSTCRNSNSIGVEMCSRKDEEEVYYIKAETQVKTVVLVKTLMQKHNVPKANILRHYDVTGKVCPEPFVRDSSQWSEFLSHL
jgi:N-acetylmuramoyl-L-alanine amidase